MDIGLYDYNGRYYAPSVYGGMGLGVQAEVSTTYHLGDDSFATAECLCSDPMTPNAGLDVLNTIHDFFNN